MEHKKSKLVKIFIPFLIVAIICGMWFVKNHSDNTEAPVITELTADQLAGADFSLNATELIGYEALSENGLPVIVDYGADSCIPCKEMAPVFMFWLAF